MSSIADFDRLMLEVSSGSEKAMWELAETYTPYIIRAVRASLPRQIRQKLDSQDFAQTLWASLLLKRTELQRLKTPDELIAFLARAARYKVIDATRRYLGSQKYNVSREQSLEDVRPQGRAASAAKSGARLYSREPTPSEFASVRERWNHILAKSSERDRDILQLRLEGKTFDAISEKLKINQATARRAIHHLIDQLSE